MQTVLLSLMHQITPSDKGTSRLVQAVEHAAPSL